MRDYIVHGALLVSFLACLVVYALLQLDGTGQPGPLDELLLVLGGAIAGAAIPRGGSSA